MRNVKTNSMRISTTVALTLVLVALFALPSVAAATEQPSLTAISASAGSPGDRVTLQGSGFGDAASETSFVSFAGARAATESWSDTRVVAVVPSRAVAGYVGVTVDNQTSNGLWFAPNGRPQVTAISQTMAPPGTTVTILGSGFGATQRTGWVTFGGRPAPVVSWSTSRIVAIVPQLSGATWVGVWQNGAPSNGLWFTPFLPPEIESVSRTRARAGQSITLTGKRFGVRETPGGVKLAGAAVTPTEWTDTSITFTVPNDAKSGYVGVWRGGASSNGRFVYVAPEIEAISSWWVEPGSELTIDGEGFSSATRVTIAGQEAPIISQSDSRIVVTVPLDAQEGAVGVWNGGAASNGVWLLPIYQARIGTLSNNIVAVGEQIEILGSHFGTGQGSSEVRLGGSALTVLEWSDSRIVVRLPAGAESGYLGVWKRGIASAGRWVTVTAE